MEYEYEKEFDFLYFIPSWYVQSRQYTSVQKSVYTVIAPIDLRPRFKQRNFEGDHFSEKKEDGKTIFEWNFENVRAMELEPYGPDFTELVPSIFLAPSKFEYEGYTGDMSSWNGFANWQQKLNEGRGELPLETINELKNLVVNLDDDRDKIRVVYEYLQSNTRYVSIQLGIGGLQPFEATVVDDLGYGDCKALSNYTLSLLDAVGVKSFYTKVDAGSDPRPLDPDFTIPSFNHIILCVPNKGDTIWLETTSQTNPFGYMGTFTGDRDVLLVTDAGGKIVHTPVYDESVSTQIRKADVDLFSNGDAEASVKTSYNGLKYESENLNFIVEKGEMDKKNWVANNTQIPNFDLVSYDFKVFKKPIPEVIVESYYEVSKHGKLTGKRLFFSVNLMNRIERLPKVVDDRETDFIQDKVFTEIDTVTYSFDPSYKFEYVPEDVKLDSKFGEYESTTLQQEGKLTFIRRYVLKKGRYPAEDYEVYRDFLSKVIKADAGKVVLNGAT